LKKKTNKTEVKTEIMKNYKTIIALIAAGIACSATTSKATLVPATTLTGSPTQIGSTLVGNYNVDTLQGQITSTVDSGYTSNPFGAGDYTFIYQVNNTGSDFVDSLSLTGFLPGTYSIGYLTGTGTVAPLDYFASGQTLTIDFLDANGGTQINQNQTSDKIVIYTSGTTVSVNNGSVKDDNAANAPILAPVPEPSTIAAGILMLLPFGIGAVRSLRKDRIA